MDVVVVCCVCLFIDVIGVAVVKSALPFVVVLVRLRRSGCVCLRVGMLLPY